ncbi:porin family protein [Bacteroides sp.]|uniref:porin family protein n=1 Tax=Bacteroides sp. TaxID=29523 RepID=UPI003AB6B169
MKKLLVMFALLAVSFAGINAQENVKWGATLGLNSSNFSTDGFDSKIGFHAGVKAEVGLPQIAEGVYLDMGALLSLKGAKVDGGSFDIKYTPYYLEVPVHMGYKYAVNDNFAIFGNAGPYIAVGLFGKAKADGVEVDNTSDNVFDEDGGGMNRFDFGLGLKFGVEFCRKYQVSFGYDWGLIDNADHVSNKNRNLMISLSYMF